MHVCVHNQLLNKGCCWVRPEPKLQHSLFTEESCGTARSQETRCSTHHCSPRGQNGARSASLEPSCASIVDIRCFCFSMFSLFSCLLACLLDLLLSRVADEAFYKQPFADVIGYVYVAKLIPFLFWFYFLFRVNALFVTSCFAFYNTSH